jgi:hypothetical protein
MKGQDKYSWNWKRIAGTGIAAVVLTILFCLGGAGDQGCNVRYQSAWVVAEILRHVALACWQLVPTYLCENSRCCEHLLPLVASAWPLFWFIAG